MKSKILLYGANGYTGKLLSSTLLQKGIRPILAARSTKINAVAQQFQCDARIFPTSNAAAHLEDIDILINLAGPFAQTQEDLIRACIKSKTHYLDIAGEVPEMERAYAFQEAAQAAKIVVISGAGFGVVPTDIAAALAAQKLPEADTLIIAYATEGEASRGTLKTVLKDINKPGIIIKNGQQESALPAMQDLAFSVLGKSFKAVYNPWRADLFTAQKSTGIANISTYSVFPNFVVAMMKGRLLWLRNLLLRYLINWLPEGPNKKQLQKGKTYIKAIARAGEKEANVEMVGPEAYVFTMECLYALIQVLEQNTTHYGILPPSIFGKALVESIEGVQISL